MSFSSKDIYEFGPYTLDREALTLNRGEEAVLLPPKLYEVLTVLVSSSGATVTKEQLIETVWPNCFVEESNLSQSIFGLRRRLGKTATGEEYIQTVPRRGYRLSVPVRKKADPAYAPSPGLVTEQPTTSASVDESALTKVPSVTLSPKVFRSRSLHWLIPAAIVLLAAISTTILLHLQPKSQLNVRYVQLTRDGMDKRGKTGEMAGPDAALATDGNRLYFTEGSSNTPRLVQVSVAGGQTVAIPLPFPIVQLFDYSKTRSELLVGNYANPVAPAELWAVAVPSGAAHRIGEVRAADAAWSPDGARIAYVVGKELFVVSADGAAELRIALLPGVGWRPRWAPDGRSLRLTIVDANAQQTLWELESNGSNLRPLFPKWKSSSGQCCGIWTNDGKHFIFQSVHDGKAEIWSRDEPGKLTSLLHLNPAPVQISSGPGDSLVPAVSPDDSQIYAVNRQLRGELLRYEPNTRQFLPYMDGASLDFLEFSRDRQWVTYVAYPEGTLWRSKADGSQRLQLTFAPMQVMVPHWSPDGQQIQFHGFGDGVPNDTYVISLQGGLPKRVSSHGGEMMNSQWSPDGKSLLYSDFPFFGAKPESIALHILNLETRQITGVPQSQGLISPTWSPDGRYLTAFKLVGQEIMLFDSKTQAWSELGEGWGLLRWSHSGGSLYYLRYGQEPALMSIRISDHRVNEIADLKSLRLGGRLAGLEFSLDPDDTPLFLRDTGTQEVFAIQHWD